MDGLEIYLMQLLNHIKAVRKLPLIYALMTGKRTGQAVQEAHLFKMKHLFGLTPKLKEAEFFACVDRLAEQGWVRVSEAGCISVRETADERFERPDWQGFLIQKRAHNFFLRLLLASQVISQRQHGRVHYLPAVRDKAVQFHIKEWLRGSQNFQLTERLREELVNWLGHSEIKYPELVAFRLSGGEWIGLTEEQLYERCGLSYWDGYFEWLYAIHFLFQHQADFPILQSLMPAPELAMTSSGTATFLQMNEVAGIEQLAGLRHLKQSTIEDHLVEIQATFPGKNFEGLPDQAVCQEIAQGSFTSLKEIKTHYPDLSYFEIRMAVVKGAR
ncbi:helix-turn-helix domain-containing protein [Listeria costaricensis]|uniref:helix-turn-helix domain-containing protein n=1 Tax=Listeria costaricensis TaxID=2026604 RepID=UPI000C079B60|nr:helix-turn-helix domain-containing protein [Listeria costaricensis]